MILLKQNQPQFSLKFKKAVRKESCMTKILKSLLFPEKCASCGKIVRKVPLCQNCFDELCETIETECNVCGKTVDDCECIKLKGIKLHFIPFWYKGTVLRRAVYRLKMSNMKTNTDLFASMICNHIMIRLGEIDPKTQFDVITYVPRSIDQKNEFGVDQSEFLAKRMSKMLDIPCEPLLIRVGGKQQKRLHSKERIENVKESFAPLPKAENYKNVLLVDDVITTGATVTRCAQMLKMAGVKNVSVAAIAKTVF